jgi:hypothetical protein
MLSENEAVREALSSIINSMADDREELEDIHGQVWDTNQLTQDYAVEGFAAPFVVVRRKSDGVRGTLTFQHSPRYYYDFTPE